MPTGYTGFPFEFPARVAGTRVLQGVTFANATLTSSGDPPVLTVTSTPTLDTDPVVVTLYDTTPGLRTHVLWARFGGAGSPGHVVHDGTNFWPGFAARSTRTGAGTLATPYTFTIYRDPRWPAGTDIDLYVRAVDQHGNMLTD